MRPFFSWKENFHSLICRVITRMLGVNSDSPECKGACGHLIVIEDLRKENKRLTDEMHKKDLQLRTDNLTRLATRDAILQGVDREISRCRRKDPPTSFSIILIDIDDFGRYNKQYGHLAGDRILERIGEVIQSKVRGMDQAGRIGGDEFLIITPETGNDAALRLSERIQEAVKSNPFQDGDQQLSVTMSCGITTLCDQDTTYRDLIRRADIALRKAKASGKNQCGII